MSQTSLSQFLTLYRNGQSNVFHKRLGGLVSAEGMTALGKTLRIVRLFLPDEDVPAYVEFVMRWARSRGFRVDHEALRSPKLIGAFAKRRYRASVSATHLAAMRQTQLLRNPDYERELSALVYEARGVFATSQDWSWAFVVALDRRKWHFQNKLEELVRQFLSGDQQAMTIMTERGLYETV